MQFSALLHNYCHKKQVSEVRDSEKMKKGI